MNNFFFKVAWLYASRYQGISSTKIKMKQVNYGFQVYLKSIDDGESILEHNRVPVYGKKTKNPANSENRHQNKQSLNPSSRKIDWDVDVKIANE